MRPTLSVARTFLSAYRQHPQCKQRRQECPPPRLRVIHIPELPPGWLGKTHAMWTAGKQASGDWLLFTDADVLFKPDALRRAVAYAELSTPTTWSCFRA